MKTRLLILTVCLAVLSLGTSAKIKDGKALTGNSLTDFGKYTITNSDVPMVYKNQALKTFDLVYEETNNPIQIALFPEKDCTTFIVRSAEFEIQYTCNKGVFGVKKIEKRFQELPSEANEAKLNRVRCDLNVNSAIFFIEVCNVQPLPEGGGFYFESMLSEG